MCVGVCGKVIEIIDEQFVYVDILGIKTKVNVLLIENPKVDDYVLIHTGYALDKVNQDYADSVSGILKEMLEEEDE